MATVRKVVESMLRAIKEQPEILDLPLYMYSTGSGVCEEIDTGLSIDEANDRYHIIDLNNGDKFAALTDY